MLNVLGSVAQFEREVMLERQREGIAKAKGEGKYKGRKPTARAKADRESHTRTLPRRAVAPPPSLSLARAFLPKLTAEGLPTPAGAAVWAAATVARVKAHLAT